MDRGMVSEDNLEFMRQENRRYLVGTPKSQLRQWQAELAGDGWDQVWEGLEVKLCPNPEGTETFILCRSAARREKERARREPAAAKLEAGLQHLVEAAAKKPVTAEKLAERIGRLRERHSRASRLFETEARVQAHLNEHGRCNPASRQSWEGSSPVRVRPSALYETHRRCGVAFSASSGSAVP